jgi:hypothetical protein
MPLDIDPAPPAEASLHALKPPSTCGSENFEPNFSIPVQHPGCKRIPLLLSVEDFCGP